MRHIRIRFFVYFLLLGCNSILSSENYTIIGQTNPKLHGKEVMLFHFKGDVISRVDTTTIVGDRFRFQGEIDTAGLAVITCGNHPEIVRSAKLMLESGEINVFLDKRSKISGTPLNDIYQRYSEKMNLIGDSLEYEKNRTGLDSISSIERNNTYRNLRTKLVNLENTFIVENSNNLLGVILFRANCLSINSDNFFAIYDKSGEKLKADARIMQFYNWFKDEQQKDIERNKKMQELAGKKYTDFAFYDTGGKEVRLSDYIGKSKYTLLHFWASWCGPCMGEQPILKEIYEVYKSKGLEVINISIDANKLAWHNAIKASQSKWTELLDLNAGKSGIKEAYCFNGIPYSVLIDKNGIIVLSGMPGSFLKQMLPQLLAK